MTARAASVPAQAKINLFLQVLAREADGYHQIETLLCRIELGDVVRLRVSESATRALDCRGPSLPPLGLGPTERNLAWRAAVAYSQVTGFPRGFEIEIDKHIPVGAGLGGGSADAGAVLRLLNALSSRPLSGPALLGLGASLGADVPFLTQDASPLALAWGRGDRLLTLPPLPSRGCLLVNAPFGVSTDDAYRWIDQVPPQATGPRQLTPFQLADWPSIDSLSGNHFEEPVFARFPRLQEAYDVLVARGSTQERVVRMSGSGSTLFALDPVVSPGTTGRCPEGFRSLETRTATTVAPVGLVEG